MVDNKNIDNSLNSNEKIEKENTNNLDSANCSVEMSGVKLEDIKLNGDKVKDSNIENDKDKKDLKHVVEMPHNNRTIEINRETNFGSKNKVSEFFKKINWGIVVGILYFVAKINFGLKVEGKKTYKELKKQKKGFIVVSNHFNIMDVPLNAVALSPYKMQFTSIESNFAIPVAGRILSYFNTIPMPENPRKLLYVFEYCVKAIKEGSVIHFFPEGVLLPYNNSIKSFNKGAFLCAERAKCDILPIVFTQRKAKGPFKYLKKHQCSYTAHILQPITVNPELNKKEAVTDLENKVKQVMTDTISKYDENVVNIDYSEFV